MSLDLLDAPLRVTWDLHDPEGDPSPVSVVERVASELPAAGVFYAILERSPLSHPLIRRVLAALAAGGCSTQLVCSGSDEEWTALEKEPLSADGILLAADRFLAPGGVNENGLQNAAERLRKAGFNPGLLLRPTPLSLPLFPAVIASCRKVGIGKIKLPNTRADDRFGHPQTGVLPGPEQVEEFRRLIGKEPPSLLSGLSLEVHDLFLWEILFPDRAGGRSEYGGCQAANSLAHVDAAGGVHPCSSWPERLGSLLELSLPAIWETLRRHQIRQEIEAVPAGCGGCRDYSHCLGGCRGLGRTLNAAAGGRDPLCPGVRTG